MEGLAGVLRRRRVLVLLCVGVLKRNIYTN